MGERMILPDHEIRKLLKEGRISIEPLDDPESQIQPACVDLRLGSEFRVFKYTSEALIDSKNPKEYTESYCSGGKPFILHPKEFILGITKESIRIPGDLAAYVDGRSSLGRLGITAHITSGWVDPGFSGKLVLEISNLGKMPVTLYPGMKICKLLFFQMSSPAEVPYDQRKTAKYRNQETLCESRIHSEKD
jgi:dCTP deaminase